MPKVLVLKHYLKGDDANANGIAHALASRLGGSVESIDCQLRSNMLLPSLRALLKARRRRDAAPDPRRGLRLWPFLFSGERPEASPYTALVSTLGRGEGPAAFISSFWGVPAIHLGSPKRMTRDDLSAVVAHQGHTPEPGEIALPIAPTRILRAATPREARTCITLLAGGDVGDIKYKAQFWRDLVTGVAAFARNAGAELVIATSPRTGAAEQIIETRAQELDYGPESLALYGRPAKRSFAELLYASTTVFVTAESVSMISDAIAAGARVVAVYEKEPPRSDRIRRFLEEQSQRRRIALLDLAGGFDVTSDFMGVTPLPRCWSDDLWEQVKLLFPEPLLEPSQADT